MKQSLESANMFACQKSISKMIVQKGKNTTEGSVMTWRYEYSICLTGAEIEKIISNFKEIGLVVEHKIGQEKHGYMTNIFTVQFDNSKMLKEDVANEEMANLAKAVNYFYFKQELDIVAARERMVAVYSYITAFSAVLKISGEPAIVVDSYIRSRGTKEYLTDAVRTPNGVYNAKDISDDLKGELCRDTVHQKFVDDYIASSIDRVLSILY